MLISLNKAQILKHSSQSAFSSDLIPFANILYDKYVGFP